MNRDRLRALAAAAGLAVVIGGVPWFLYALGGGLPTGLPSAHQVHRFLGQPITDTAIMRAVSLVCWAVWALFVIAVAAEATAWLRYRPSPADTRRGFRVPGLQSTAATLFLTALLLLPQRTGTTAPSTGPGVPLVFPAATAALRGAQAAPFTLSSVAISGRLPPTPPASPTLDPSPANRNRLPYTVKRYDTLWGIAEAHLGNGLRWREITDAEGTSLATGTDSWVDAGGRLIAEPQSHLIFPGQQLLLPPDATDIATPATQAPPSGEANLRDPYAGLAPGTKAVVVRPGDTLSGIAQQHLGDWKLDAEIHQLNFGRHQPDGRALTDDHWIYPGWVLVMPTDATGTYVVPAETTPTPPAAVPLPGHIQPGPSPATTSRSSSLPSAGPPTEQNHSPVPEAGIPPVVAPPLQPSAPPGTQPRAVNGHLRQQTVREHDHARTSRHSSSAPVGPIVGVAGLVAAGVIWRLSRRRRDQMHDRPSGQKPRPNPAAVVAAETQARMIADTDTMRWVDAALRYLGGELADRQTPMSDDHHRASDPVPEEPLAVPSVVLVRAGMRGLEVMIAPSCEDPPQGWVAIDDGKVWTLDPHIDLDELETRAAGRWPFLPALVTVGATADGAVLANLEHAGSLAVEGDPELVTAVTGQMLMELTSQPWTDEMLAGLYATGDPDAGQLPGVEVDHDPTALAEHLAQTASGATAQLARTPSAAARRAVDGEYLPHIVVAFAATDADVIRSLVDTAQPDRSAVALITVNHANKARWQLTVGAAGEATLEGLAGDVPFRLPLQVQARPDLVGLLGHALANAAEPLDAQPALDDQPLIPDQPIQPDEQTSSPGEPGEVELRVLGPVHVAGAPGPQQPARRDAPLAILAYLSTHTGPVTIHDLAGALWPPNAAKEHFGMPAPKTVHNTLSRARALLGTDADGNHRLRLIDGGYVLTASVTSDWRRFQTLAGMARTGLPGEAAARYRQALELVEGTPFAGSLDSPFFEWVSSEQLEHTVTAAVVDAAEELAQLSLDHEDLDSVLWAVEVGLRIDPAREQLYQYWMHALGHSSDAGKVSMVWQRLCAALQQHIDPAQSPSLDSQSVYRTYVARSDTH